MPRPCAFLGMAPQGNRNSPSYVAYSDMVHLFGDAAKNQVARNPENAVSDATPHRPEVYGPHRAGEHPSMILLKMKRRQKDAGTISGRTVLRTSFVLLLKFDEGDVFGKRVFIRLFGGCFSRGASQKAAPSGVERRSLAKQQLQRMGGLTKGGKEIVASTETPQPLFDFAAQIGAMPPFGYFDPAGFSKKVKFFYAMRA